MKARSCRQSMRSRAFQIVFSIHCKRQRRRKIENRKRQKRKPAPLNDSVSNVEVAHVRPTAPPWKHQKRNLSRAAHRSLPPAINGSLRNPLGRRRVRWCADLGGGTRLSLSGL